MGSLHPILAARTGTTRDGWLENYLMRSTPLSMLFFVAGWLSILLSLALWFVFPNEDAAMGQRLAIFVGLWPPTLFILSERFSAKNGADRV